MRYALHVLSDEETMDSEQANYYCAISADTKQEIISSYSTARQSLTIRPIRQRDGVHTESGDHNNTGLKSLDGIFNKTYDKREGTSMKVLDIIIGTLLIACAGCASNLDGAGQALSGVLMGIGQGLSGL